jgi:hypothetical protein
MARRIPLPRLGGVAEPAAEPFSFAGMTEGDETRRTTCTIGATIGHPIAVQTINSGLEEDTETAQPGNAATSNFETKRS